MFTPFKELPQYEEYGAHEVDEDLADIAFDGSGCLSQQENLKVINLVCDTSVKDILSQFQVYGEIQTNEFPNYKQLLARCPMHCNIRDPKTITKADKKTGMTNKTLEGTGIHPYDSSICVAALIDYAMPVNGGVIAVALAPGQSE